MLVNARLARPLVALVLAANLFTGYALAADAPASADAGLSITPLDEYVAKPDPNFKWDLLNTIPGDGYSAHVLKMTSQQWLTTAEVNNPIWWHWMTIVVPDKIESETGFLYIGAGNNESNPPSGANPLLVALAMKTGTVTAELGMVPNQPLVFADDDGKRRSEDSAIAYTWDRYIVTGDPKWPMRLPMTKAAVRAMDTITEFTSSENGGGTPVTQFVVAGGSKRGWTTWTTAAVDGRVVAIAPIVIDMLNVIPSFVHHYNVYGRYANAVQDYVVAGIMDRQDDPNYHKLLKIVEPYEYRDRFHIPKFIVNSTGDQFFLPDSWQFYWDDLDGEKYLRYVPNSDHGMGGTDVIQSVIAWYHAIVHNVPRPRFSWRVEPDGEIRVLALDKPREVLLWQANSPDARDFRKERIGAAYTSSPLTDQGGGVYTARVNAPEKGWTAYYIELIYDSGTDVPFKFSTGVKVVPDEYPDHKTN
jgi:PhoPQ-activated pathogenicity-related protein